MAYGKGSFGPTVGATKVKGSIGAKTPSTRRGLPKGVKKTYLAGKGNTPVTALARVTSTSGKQMVTGSGVNKMKGNPRAGLGYFEFVKNGRRYHAYNIKGKRVVVGMGPVAGG